MPERPCQICQKLFTAINSRNVNCDEHKGYVVRQCKTCKTSFPVKTSGAKGKRYCNPNCRPKRDGSKNMAMVQARGRERVTTPKQCEACGADFYPRKAHAHCQKYCDSHRYSAKRVHVVDANEGNPYKIGTLKNCEAQTHRGCTGKMIVFKNNWTHCGLCAKPHTGRQVYLKTMNTY